MSTYWGSDAMPSMPEPMKSSQPVLVDFEAMGMTAGGIAHRITEDEWEALIVPMFAPEGGIEGVGEVSG